jgi:hypothetical protein
MLAERNAKKAKKKERRRSRPEGYAAFSFVLFRSFRLCPLVFLPVETSVSREWTYAERRAKGPKRQNSSELSLKSKFGGIYGDAKDSTLCLPQVNRACLKSQIGNSELVWHPRNSIWYNGVVDGIENNLAEPESLLGMLRRGRGKGYLAALKPAPEAVWPLLFECITNDPRLDRQCEAREEYYASLIVATGMDLEPLRSHLVQNDAADDDDWSVGLLLSTLSCLAEQKRSPAALQILREYVSYGSAWHSVLFDLMDADTSAGLELSVAVLCRRIARDADVRADFEDNVREDWESYCQFDEELRTRVRHLLPVCEPWKTICSHNKEFAALFRDIGIAYDQPPPAQEGPSREYLAGLSLAELFAQVDKSNYVGSLRVLPEKVLPVDEDYLLEQLETADRYRMMLAFRGLGALGTPRAFDVVKSYIEASENADRMVRRCAFEAFEEMPAPLTLDLARCWFRREEWHFQIPAGGVLERHATLEDVPLLIETLRTPETIQCEDFRLSAALDALAGFEGLGWIPEIEQVFCEVQDCFRRYDAARAMHVTAPAEFVSKYAFECLWDCHWNTRELGCKVVDLSTPGVVERLRELAADQNESDSIRQAAREALGDVSTP